MGYNKNLVHVTFNCFSSQICIEWVMKICGTQFFPIAKDHATIHNYKYITHNPAYLNAIGRARIPGPMFPFSKFIRVLQELRIYKSTMYMYLV